VSSFVMGSFILRTPFNRSVPLAGSENIPVHSLCTKENWKGQKRRDASKGQNGRSRRKAGVRTFTPWPPLGQKMGEPSAYVPGEDENLISEPLSQIPNLGVKIFRTFG
jgi:hypothetical protein